MAAAAVMTYPVRDGYTVPPIHRPMHQTKFAYPYNRMRRPVEPRSNVDPGFIAQSQQVMLQESEPRAGQLPSIADAVSRPLLPSISSLLRAPEPEQSQRKTDYQVDAHTSATRPAGKATASSMLQKQSVVEHSAWSPSSSRPHGKMDEHGRPAAPAAALAPVPPLLRSDSFVASTNSSSTTSTGSSLSNQAHMLHSSINNLEPHKQRVVDASRHTKHHSLPVHNANTSPNRSALYMSSPYSASPGIVANSPFYSPPDLASHSTYPPTIAPAGLLQQRPLPIDFPPPLPTQSPAVLGVQRQHLSRPASSYDVAAEPPATNPWEHHHYISQSSQATYPQIQDRYICQICSKAFSRPSSLKIHSHSHTGEKPFKCPFAGCGKAFSVRSNMKRHERGCHSASSPPAAGTGLQTDL